MADRSTTTEDKQVFIELAQFQDTLACASAMLPNLDQSDLMSALLLAMQLQSRIVGIMMMPDASSRPAEDGRWSSTTEASTESSVMPAEAEAELNQDRVDDVATVAIESEILSGELGGGELPQESPSLDDADEDSPPSATKRIKLELAGQRTQPHEELGFFVAQVNSGENESTTRDEECDFIVDPEDGGFIIPGFTIVDGSSHCQDFSSAEQSSSSPSSSYSTKTGPPSLPFSTGQLLLNSRVVSALTRAAVFAAANGKVRESGN
uniref:Rubis-subs-bind domain-containing protein n=2 Tax=Macrostomum lignano TaxID=282301 RepID=A0A1I8H0D5_9PLAT